MKCITTAAGLVASGGADDLIHLYVIQAGHLVNICALLYAAAAAAAD